MGQDAVVCFQNDQFPTLPQNVEGKMWRVSDFEIGAFCDAPPHVGNMPSVPSRFALEHSPACS